jgi:hypothetical protein
MNEPESSDPTATATATPATVLKWGTIPFRLLSNNHLLVRQKG